MDKANLQIIRRSHILYLLVLFFKAHTWYEYGIEFTFVKLSINCFLVLSDWNTQCSVKFYYWYLSFPHEQKPVVSCTFFCLQINPKNLIWKLLDMHLCHLFLYSFMSTPNIPLCLGPFGFVALLQIWLNNWHFFFDDFDFSNLFSWSSLLHGIPIPQFVITGLMSLADKPVIPPIKETTFL